MTKCAAIDGEIAELPLELNHHLELGWQAGTAWKTCEHSYFYLHF